MARSRSALRRRITSVLTVLLSAAAVAVSAAPAAAATTPVNQAGISTAVDPSGAYTITSTSPAWTFGGNIGHGLSNIATTTGTDGIGAYQEVGFTWTSTAGAARAAAIRSYNTKPVVLFTDKYLTTATNIGAFPSFITYPQNPYHVSYPGVFAQPSFSQLNADGPWVFFDGSANTFVLSAASQFQQTSLTRTSSGTLVSGIIPTITSFPAGFTHQSMLVIQHGIGAAYDTFGHAMTDLQGKTRPANDADVDLNKFGYWTDNGAYYWYNYDQSLGYAGTILAVRDYFQQLNVPLGYMQLDSWWYPKGPNADWSKSGYGNGEYTYTAAAQLFPNGLTAFQQQLGLPMITHARWIDAASPYRGQYTISNNVSTDPRFWHDIMGYIHNANVVRYEQDWLSEGAQPAYNLTDPDLYFDNMAAAAAADGMTVQYCMALARDLLQSSKYSNLTTVRVSDDRFQRSRWHGFLYTSQLAAAMGDWPWADVFKSSELDNMILATLSAGQVGVGGQIGTTNRANIMQAIRSDGVIVKPDTPIVPTDASYVNDAQNLGLPEIADTSTDFGGGLKAHYIFAYDQNSTNTTARFTPASLGLSGQVYIYNYATGTGTLLPAQATFSDNFGTAGHGYYIAVPVGASNVGFLGDASKIASLGKKRISQVSDNGTLHATVVFAPGEAGVTVHGYAATAPQITASKGSIGPVTYDAATRQFSVVVNRSSDNTAMLNLTASATTTTWYEAEQATLSGPATSTEWPGYTGTGYADYRNATGDYVEWTVTVGSAGAHTLGLRYANGTTGDRPLTITVNGTSTGSNLSFPSTGTWSSWRTVTRGVNLTPGTYRIRATTAGASGGNIDRLEVS